MQKLITPILVGLGDKYSNRQLLPQEELYLSVKTKKGYTYSGRKCGAQGEEKLSMIFQISVIVFTLGVKNSL